jgi:hypothetical protein
MKRWCYKCGGYKMKTGGINTFRDTSHWSQIPNYSSYTDKHKYDGMSQEPSFVPTYGFKNIKERRSLDQLPFFQGGGFTGYYTGPISDPNDIPLPQEAIDAQRRHQEAISDWGTINPAIKWENRMGTGLAVSSQQAFGNPIDPYQQIQTEFDNKTQKMLNKGRTFDNDANMNPRKFNPMAIGNAMNYATAGLSELAGMHDRNMQQNYVNRMQNNPLSGILPFNDMRSENVEYGYNTMQFGGISNPFKMKMDRQGKLKFKGDINSFNSMIMNQNNDYFGLNSPQAQNTFRDVLGYMQREGLKFMQSAGTVPSIDEIEQFNPDNYKNTMKSALDQSQKHIENQGDKMSFGKAFALNRALGREEFTWKGNRYTTKLKEELKSKTQPSNKNSQNASTNQDYATRMGLNDRIIQVEKGYQKGVRPTIGGDKTVIKPAKNNQSSPTQENVVIDKKRYSKDGIVEYYNDGEFEGTLIRKNPGSYLYNEYSSWKKGEPKQRIAFGINDVVDNPTVLDEIQFNMIPFSFTKLNPNRITYRPFGRTVTGKPSGTKIVENNTTQTKNKKPTDYTQRINNLTKEQNNQDMLNLEKGLKWLYDRLTFNN